MKNKKNLIFMIPLLALFIFVILLVRSNKKNTPVPVQTFTKVNNYSQFFGIDSLVNDYVKKSNSGRVEYYYYTNDIYYLSFKRNYYYIVVGDKVKYDYDTSKLEMISDISYLITVQISTSKYDVEEIDNYQDYLVNSKLRDGVTVKSNESISNYDNKAISDMFIMNYYINYFKELLFVNYTKAYNMLDSKYREKVGSIDDFNSYREELYNSINNIIINYSINGEKGNRSYSVVLNNNLILEFKENSIMNFSVNIRKYE